ncbi:CDP-glycerol glycerophosphotransferase family protein [Fictibacillus gelatini]|uniref:CDP-glycerol glycerophosphotransferase family protein n=1 Tax=Fictibacillus gelatini TaxID=225985 RepID=UPI0004075F06|nr:CDP-glycerol glycerophosphotransferase family protein [Fictibacillus gelatini]
MDVRNTTIRNRTLHSLTFANDQYRLQIHFKHNEAYENAVNKSILFINRQSAQELSFPLHQIEEIDEFRRLEAVIPLAEYAEQLAEGGVWDAYIVLEVEQTDEETEEEETTLGEDDPAEDDEAENETDLDEADASEDNERGPVIKRYRLKSNEPYLELLYYTNPAIENVIIPYTTNKGNVSIKAREPGVIAKIEEMSLSKSGKLSLTGYVIHTDVTSTEENRKKTLVLKHKDGNEYRFEARTVKRNDLTERYGKKGRNYDSAGFEVEVELGPFGSVPEDRSLKLWMELQDNDVIEGEVPLASPLKWIRHKGNPGQSIILKSKNGKKKFSLKARKKSRNVSLRIAEYSLKRELISRAKKLGGKVKRHKLTKAAYLLVFKFVGFLPAKKNLIMFESFAGKQYSDNPRAIYEYLCENHPEYKMVWSFNRKTYESRGDDSIPCVRRFSIRWLFLMARARYWVVNSRLPLWIPKPAHTIYLQTWHGTPLKRLAADMDEVHMPGTNTKKYKRNFIREARRWDYLISPNAYSTEIFKRAFQFEKEMIESGYPRNDFLHLENNPDSVRKLKESLGVPLDKKIILYAPTWRDDQFYGKGRYKFDLDLDLNLLREKLGDDYVLILRMHYLVAENFDLAPFEGFAYDFSSHKDIRELYLIADLLITDYSSVFFDYANLKRPMIFYVYDIETYRDKLRGFYFDFEQYAPGPLVKTTPEVIRSIREIEANDFKPSEILDEFYDKFCYLETGHSSQKVVERVFLNK